MHDMLNIQGLHKSYGNHHVLKGLDLTVRKGHIHTVLGSNGAGKTTMIKILATLLNKDAGKILIAGYDLDQDIQAIKRVIGYVGQDTERSAYARLTARENLMYFGQLHGLGKRQIQSQIDLFCDLFSIGDLMDRNFMTLSGGQKQIIVITRALLHDPAFIILDEPTKGLDPGIAHRMRDFLKTYVKTYQKTILLTSHILNEVEYLSDTVTLLSGGKVLLEGSTDDLKMTLGADVFLEVDVDKTHPAILRQLDQMFPKKRHGREQIVAYPLNDLCDDSIQILNMARAYNNQIAFNYSYTSLENVFLYNVNGFDDRFE